MSFYQENHKFIRVNNERYSKFHDSVILISSTNQKTVLTMFERYDFSRTSTIYCVLIYINAQHQN